MPQLPLIDSLRTPVYVNVWASLDLDAPTSPLRCGVHATNAEGIVRQKSTSLPGLSAEFLPSIAEATMLQFLYGESLLSVIGELPRIATNARAWAKVQERSPR